MTSCGCSGTSSTWRTTVVSSDGAETAASRSVACASASAVMRSAESSSPRAPLRSIASGRGSRPRRSSSDGVVAVALGRRHAAGGGVRVAEHAQALELGELVAHRRGRGHDRALLHERARADRDAGLDVGLDDAQEQRFLARGEGLVGAHAITLETTSLASRRPRGVSRRVPSAGSMSPSEAMRASPSGSIASSSPADGERHVEPQAEHQALARALLRRQLLERRAAARAPRSSAST